jgi:hypothetical protein
MNMTTKLRPFGLAGLAMLLLSTSLFAHHSFAAFDMAKTSTLSGVVKEFQWLNPHSWIQMMVKDASGNEVEWSIETGSPSSLARQGWKSKTLKPGDQIIVTMHPLRDGRPGGSLITVTMADGTKIGGNPAGEASEPSR